MANENDELKKLEDEVQRIRSHRSRRGGITTVRNVLNILFLVVAAVGLYLYFTHEPGERKPALLVLLAAMMMKVLEFILHYTA